MTDLRVAIIGYGLAGRAFHAPLIDATPGLRLTSVVTGDPQRQAHAAERYPGIRTPAGPEELWELGDHDLVVVATPTDSHVPLAAEAIDRGIAIVVDKPMAASAADAEALVAQARDAGVMLTVFQNRRWDSDHLTLSRLMTEGRLGRVIRYESRFERWRPQPGGAWRESTPPERGGGQLLDLGSHLVDQALVLFGSVTHLYAEVDARRGLPSDDDVFLALHHAGGTLSHLRVSAITAAPGPRLRVLGTEAAYVAPQLDTQEDRLRAGSRPDTAEAWGAEPQSHWGRLVTGDYSIPIRSERGSWPAFYARLEAALRTGGPPPVDPADAVTTLRVLESARRAAKTGTTVSLS
ncbi:MAG TPA: Gfo/Idh/MocA family oxidoreductase [Solirubrobacteraceae bacterium]